MLRWLLALSLGVPALSIPPVVVRPDGVAQDGAAQDGAAQDGAAQQGEEVVRAPLPPRPAPLRPSIPAAPQSFDRSLQQLERDRVITPQERRTLERGLVTAPVPQADLQKACAAGALSRTECAGGVARRFGARKPIPTVQMDGQRVLSDLRDMRPAPARPPLTIPVAALLAGGGGTFSLESVFAVTPRPMPQLGNGNRRLLFPVVGQSFTSSGFGWRLHPILGSWLMHAGRDFAAPEGAPVVAALSGDVVSSGLAGGYGITVVIEHRQPRRRTLYGHLSEIYVKAGQQVQQGRVIGRVGSTGLSTGPHLHFELRRPQAGGWVAVDPKDLDTSSIAAQMAEEGDDAVSLLMAQLLRSLERPQSVKQIPPSG